MTHTCLYLASASPRRHEILTQLHIPHQILTVPSPQGEDEPRLPGELPAAYVRRTAREKAQRAANRLAQFTANARPPTDSTSYILSADTTVILNQDILGKPTDRQDAATTLKRLSGRTHEVHTAVALYHDGVMSESVSISTVRFKILTDTEIANYCATDDPMGKAGAYGIQGPAAAFVSHLSGSYTGVMGLPAYETVQLLTHAGYCW